MDVRVGRMCSGLSVVCRVMWRPWHCCVGTFDDLGAVFFAFLDDIAGTRAGSLDFKLSWTCVSV